MRDALPSVAARAPRVLPAWGLCLSIKSSAWLCCVLFVCPFGPLCAFSLLLCTQEAVFRGFYQPLPLTSSFQMGEPIRRPVGDPRAGQERGRDIYSLVLLPCSVATGWCPRLPEALAPPARQPCLLSSLLQLPVIPPSFTIIPGGGPWGALPFLVVSLDPNHLGK